MQIQCECGQFRAELENFPRNTPGRAVCYCDDCQTYLHHLGRADLLDANGGTEIIPIYPSEMKITSGREVLVCTQLSAEGLPRWSTSCCKTPVGNAKPGFPWVGIPARAYTVKDPTLLERTLGPIKSRIMGRFAKGSPPEGTSAKLSFKDAMVVLPFILKGFLLKKAKNSPFFDQGGVTPIVPVQVVPTQERAAIRKKLGFSA